MGTKTENGFTASLIFGFIIILGIIIATSPPLGSVLIIFIVLLGISYFSYLFAQFKDKLLPISFKGDNFKRSIFWGGLFSGGFIILKFFFPSLSIGLPITPAAISDDFKLIIIVLIAPIAEEIFFRSVVLSYLRVTKYGRNNIWFAIIGQALLFALAHIGAYTVGFYNYPSFALGLDAIQANITAFGAAFVFGILAGWFVTKNGIRNLVFSIIFHMMLNLIIFTNKFVIISFFVFFLFSNKKFSWKRLKSKKEVFESWQ